MEIETKLGYVYPSTKTNRYTGKEDYYGIQSAKCRLMLTPEQEILFDKLSNIQGLFVNTGLKHFIGENKANPAMFPLDKIDVVDGITIRTSSIDRRSLNEDILRLLDHNNHLKDYFDFSKSTYDDAGKCNASSLVLNEYNNVFKQSFSSRIDGEIKKYNALRKSKLHEIDRFQKNVDEYVKLINKFNQDRRIFCWNKEIYDPSEYEVSKAELDKLCELNHKHDKRELKKLEEREERRLLSASIHDRDKRRVHMQPYYDKLNIIQNVLHHDVKIVSEFDEIDKELIEQEKLNDKEYADRRRNGDDYNRIKSLKLPLTYTTMLHTLYKMYKNLENAQNKYNNLKIPEVSKSTFIFHTTIRPSDNPEKVQYKFKMSDDPKEPSFLQIRLYSQKVEKAGIKDETDTSIYTNIEISEYDDYFRNMILSVEDNGIDHYGDLVFNRIERVNKDYHMWECTVPVVNKINKEFFDSKKRPRVVCGVDLGVKRILTACVTEFDDYGYELQHIFHYFGGARKYNSWCLNHKNKVRRMQRKYGSNVMRNNDKAARHINYSVKYTVSRFFKWLNELGEKYGIDKIDVITMEDLSDIKAKRQINNRVNRKMYDGLTEKERKQYKKEKDKNKNYRTGLTYWSYSKMQNIIQNKAHLNGIVVQYVDPKETSHACPECGSPTKLYIPENVMETEIVTESKKRRKVYVDKNTGEIVQLNPFLEICMNDKCRKIMDHDKKGAYNISRSYKLSFNTGIYKYYMYDNEEKGIKAGTINLDTEHVLFSKHYEKKMLSAKVKKDTSLEKNGSILTENGDLNQRDITRDYAPAFSKHGYTFVGRTETIPEITMKDRTKKNYEDFSNKKFICWIDDRGKKYNPGDKFKIDRYGMQFYAVWE